MNTTNATTVKKAVQLRERIQEEFKALLVLIKGAKDGEAIKKIKFLYTAINVFVEDEKDNLYKSDVVALEILHRQVLVFIKEYEKKTLTERIAIAQSLQRIAEKTLKTS